MTPKVHILTHEVLMNCFYFPRLYGNKERLDADIKEIEDFSSKHEEKIVELIQKYAGFNWTLPRIPVYLIPDNPMLMFSYAKYEVEPGVPGIILKIGRGIRDHWILIHELVHINQKQSEYSKEYGFNNEKKRRDDLMEVCADIITLYILRDIFGIESKYEKDFFDFLQNTSEKNSRRYQFLEKFIEIVDLKTNTLKHYLETTPNLVDISL